MHFTSRLRLAILAFLFTANSFTGQAQSRKAPIVSRDGSWVLETPAKGRQCIVRFYTTLGTLIYEERLDRRLNINRPVVRRTLNIALEQALFVWNATHQVPADRQWVAIQFDKK